MERVSNYQCKYAQLMCSSVQCELFVRHFFYVASQFSFNKCHSHFTHSMCFSQVISVLSICMSVWKKCHVASIPMTEIMVWNGQSNVRQKKNFVFFFTKSKQLFLKRTNSLKTGLFFAESCSNCITLLLASRIEITVEKNSRVRLSQFRYEFANSSFISVLICTTKTKKEHFF